MNEIKLKVNFGKRTCVKSGISLTTGDYNSTKIKFEFDREDGTKIFEMKNPNDEIIFVDEIVNNEVTLVGHADVTTKHNNVTYTKYTDDNETIYWYDNELEKLYNTSFEEVQNVSLDSLTKVTENASLFTMSGRYVFEISLYDGDSKLTSKWDYLDVKEEQVVINNNMVSLYLPVFDRLIGELDNLDIDVEKSGSTTTVTLYRKDGTSDTIEINDGVDGTDGQDGQDGLTPTIGDNGNWYLGETDTGKPSRGMQGETGVTGQDGQDGFSPIATVTETSDGATISITDKNGTTTANIYNGTGGGGTSDYRSLENKPQINNVELTGNKTSSDLGLQPAGNYVIDSNYVHTDNNYSSNEKNKLASLNNYDDTEIKQDISSKQGITDNTLTTNNKTIPTAINEVNSIAKGANQALSYSNYQSMINVFNSLSANAHNVGQNVMIVTLNVPDLWISAIESTSQSYTYTSDSDFTNALATNGYVQVGYYKLSALETQKVDLTNYVTNTDYANTSEAGVIKSSSTYATNVSSGVLQSSTKTYSDYTSGNNNMFISKGTLENVFTGKGFITSHQDITGKENTSNKVTSISSSSTDTEYPSAKAVYDYIQSLDGDEVYY